jgi:integrase/recombinase XerD
LWVQEGVKMEDKIDIHGLERGYDRAVSTLMKDQNMDEENRGLIVKFAWDCKLGKTLKGKAKKKIGKSRILKYIYILRIISRWLNKPFDEVTQQEMEKLVFNIEENIYRKRNGNFSEETKLDYKKTLKKFYKWLGKTELVDFIDMSVKPKDVPAITREEVEKMVNSTPDIGLKATLMVLFDGGARAEEFLNIRIKDLTTKRYENDNDCFWVNIRHSKTFPRTIPLPLCTRYLNEWLDEHPERTNPEAQLLPVKYRNLSREVRKLAEKVLKKRVTIHMLRHSSATYWAPKMNRYQLCAKYGWAFSSNMPDRYIERKGIIFDQIAEKGDTDQTTRLLKENRNLAEKIEALEREYTKVKKVLEFMMPVIENMDEDLRKQVFEKRKEQLIMTLSDQNHSSFAGKS